MVVLLNVSMSDNPVEECGAEDLVPPGPLPSSALLQTRRRPQHTEVGHTLWKCAVPGAVPGDLLCSC